MKNTPGFHGCRAGLAFAVIGWFSMLQGGISAERDVQIRSVDFTTDTVELFNFGATDESLGGWRFCTHDEDQFRVYSRSSGLNGSTIEAGTSFFIHFGNDAPAGDPDRINASTVGNFAGPLDSGAYGMQLYFPPVSFGNGATIADHLQWSPGGVDNPTADDRSDEAQSGGVWSDQSVWIETTGLTERIVLQDSMGGVLHGPSDYTVVEPVPFDPASFIAEVTGLDSKAGVTLGWTEVPGATSYQVFSSPDLVTWTSLETTTNLEFTDPVALGTKRYYRVEVTR